MALPLAARCRVPALGRQMRAARSQARQCAAHSRRARMRAAIDEFREMDMEGGTCTKLEWKSPLTMDDMVRYPDPRLRRPNDTIATFGEDLKRLADEMFDVMYKDDGMGLAAPQVGLNLRLMVFNVEGVRGKGKELVLVNPIIMSSGKALWTEEEACLSFRTGRTAVVGSVTRPEVIKIKAKDADGQPVRCSFDGWAARVFQHEFDHLQGILFPDRMPLEEIEGEKDKLLALERAFSQRSSERFTSILDRLQPSAGEPRAGDMDNR